MPTNLFNSHQAAEILNLSPLTITNLVRQGKLKAAKVGREWIFTAEDIKAYQENKTAKANS